MRILVLAMGAVCALALLAGGSKPQKEAAPAASSACEMVQKAFADYERIAPGLTRAQVEKYFAYDGGLQFPTKARYVYPPCHYLKLEVEYEVAGPAPRGSVGSPQDKVRSVSQLFVGLPVMD